MDLKSIIAVLDTEIDTLKKARAILSGAGPLEEERRRKRHLSPEGPARIAAAARNRWAAQKRSKA